MLWNAFLVLVTDMGARFSIFRHFHFTTSGSSISHISLRLHICFDLRIRSGVRSQVHQRLFWGVGALDSARMSVISLLLMPSWRSEIYEILEQIMLHVDMSPLHSVCLPNSLFLTQRAAVHPSCPWMALHATRITLTIFLIRRVGVKARGSHCGVYQVYM